MKLEINDPASRSDVDDLRPHLTEKNIFHHGFRDIAGLFTSDGPYIDAELASFVPEVDPSAPHESDVARLLRSQRQLIALTMVVGRKLEAISQHSVSACQHSRLSMSNVEPRVIQAKLRLAEEQHQGISDNPLKETLSDLHVVLKEIVKTLHWTHEASLANQNADNLKVLQALKDLQHTLLNPEKPQVTDK